MKCPPCLLVLLFLNVLCEGQPYIITTVAGADRLQDGSSAINAPLREPRAVAVDTSGNVYIADTSDNRIRKVNASGVIGTFAGTGVPGSQGDRGKAILAQLNGPTGLAMDTNGNLFVAERDGHRIRRISPDGIINTVAGTGRAGFSGDNSPAVNAEMRPYAVAVDSKGNLYIADGLNFRIRKVDANGIITTIAGNGSEGYFGDNGPASGALIDLVTGIAVDSNGNVYIADVINERVRKIDSSGMITTFAGSGDFGTIGDGLAATSAVLLPQGVAADNSGNIYISDFNRDVVRKVNIASGLISTVAGNGSTGFSGDDGTAVRASLNSPFGLAVDSSNQVFVADLGNSRVRRVSGGVITTTAGTTIRDGGPATSAFLNFPGGIAVDGSNNIVVGDSANMEARRFSPGGNISAFGQLKGMPLGVASDQGGNFYVSDDEPVVVKVTPAGVTSILAGNGQDGYGGDNGPATSASISLPTSVAVDAAGTVYLTDFTHNRIRKVTSSGTISTFAGNGKFTFGGDNGPALSASFDPFDVATDNKGNVYIADRLNCRIRKITPDGIITTVAGNGTPGYSGDGGLATAAMLADPTGVAVDTAGNLYIADFGVVRRITASGLITTIAGNGTIFPSKGDGGPAAAAQLDPWRVAVDGSGNVYVSDSVNDHVRKLTAVMVKLAAMTIVGGNGQGGTVGTKLGAPLVVKVTDGSAGVPGVIVSFTVNPAAAATLSLSSAITLNDGTASVTVMLGNIAGPMTITASAAGVPSVSFFLTANPAVSPTAPHISSGGVVSAGLSAPAINILSPNAIATIFGEKFAPAGTSRQVSQDDLVNGRIPTMLAGVCAVFGATRAPIFGVFPGQLNVQVPQAAPGNTAVQVITNCDTPQAESSNKEAVTVQPVAPEFFYFLHNGSGHNPIAAINAITGVYVGASGLIPGGTFAPAKPGDLLMLFATGFGATNPLFGVGELPNVAAQVTGAVVIQFGGATLAAADILYVGLSQNAGLYQVNLRVPDSVVDGDQALVISIDGVSSPAGGYITVSRPSVTLQ